MDLRELNFWQALRYKWLHKILNAIKKIIESYCVSVQCHYKKRRPQNDSKVLIYKL